MPDTADMILPTLRDMRTEAARESQANAARHAQVIGRLENLEATQVSFRHALSADSLLSKLVTGDFQERIESLEKWVQEQEGRA